MASNQTPGPARGTSASAKRLLSRPTTTPVEAPKLAADAFAFTFESLTLEDGTLVGAIVVRGAGGELVRVRSGVPTRRTRVVVVTAVARGVVVVAGEMSRVRGAGGDGAVVNDITSTTNKMGLDHMRMCTLLNGLDADIIRTEG